MNRNRAGLQKKQDRQRAKVTSANLLLVLPYLCGAVLSSSCYVPREEGLCLSLHKEAFLPFQPAMQKLGSG